MDNENNLILQLKALGSAVTEKTYDEYIRQGYDILAELYALGFTQEQVYQSLIQYHHSLGDGLAYDFIAEVMDFVVGWCAPQWHIFKETNSIN